MKLLDQQFVQEMKEKLGVELAGVASIEASNELRDRAAALLPGAKSAVVFGKEICREIVRLFKSSKEAGEIEDGELIVGHSDYLNGRLNVAVHKMSEILRKEGFRSLPLSAIGPVDQRFMTSLLSYKHTAELAGLGRIGRHSLLITPEFGPRVRLACLLTEAPLEPSPKRSLKENCGSCEACIRECPAEALSMPKKGEVYSMNKFACRAYRQAGLICCVCMKTCDDQVG